MICGNEEDGRPLDEQTNQNGSPTGPMSRRKVAATPIRPRHKTEFIAIHVVRGYYNIICDRGESS